MKTLPLELLDPYDKTPLSLKRNSLSKKGAAYEVHHFQAEDKLLINFHPQNTIDRGSYSDNEEPFAFDSVVPSKQKFQKSYKSRAVSKFSKNQKANDIVVYLGCSNCEVLDRFPGDFTRIGVDISPISMMKRTPNPLDSNVDFLFICDASVLPFPDASVDLVFCTDLLEHLLAPQNVIKEISRILKPKGKLIVTVPNLVSLGNRLSLMVGSGRGIELAQLLKLKNPFIPISGPRFPDQKYHIRWFTLSSLSRFLEDNEFNILEKFGVGPITSRLKIGKFASNVSLLSGVYAEKYL